MIRLRKRILFVDDEPLILDGLRQRLRHYRTKWDMFFVEGGSDALAFMAQEHVDVVVSDMRMPGMDGIAFLGTVKRQYPGAVRIVLSGYADMEKAIGAAGVAHQFLAKPCDPGSLEAVIERICDLHELISRDSVRQAVSAIDRLPASPRVYTRLTAVLQGENITVNDVAEILKEDMAISSKVLQVANSAFFRLPRAVSSIEDAITHLGFSTIRQVVLVSEVFDSTAAVAHDGRYLDSLKIHSLRVGSLAAALSEDRRLREDAFTAGLLHDIGKLILLGSLPEYLDRTLREMEDGGCPMHLAERKAFGVTHAEIGAYLLGLWGLPHQIVDAVADHHDPLRAPVPDFGVVAAVHIANGLIGHVTTADGRDAADLADFLDMSYISLLGVDHRLQEWRELAARVVEERTPETGL